jgi:2-polyprenyl-3-methyl-5-hydroxy-6-metoxy-1,4-benzoquinol methylase
VRVVRCTRCGLVYRNPRERDFELNEIYSATEGLDPALFQALFDNQRTSLTAQARRLTRVLGRPGSVLEVASYVGAFLAAAADAGWHAEGVDINEEATAFARQHGYQVTLGDIEAVDAARRFDAVAIWNVFDQLPDPRQVARAARERLNPGGVLAVRVPNGAFYAALRPLLRTRLRRVARALLAQNNLLTFPYRFGFTPHALGRMLRDVGFAVRHVHRDTLVPVSDEWTRPWARWEERALKGAMRRLVAHLPLGEWSAPWIEVYAERD